MDLPRTCVSRGLMFACISECTNSTRHCSATRRPVSQQKANVVSLEQSPQELSARASTNVPELRTKTNNANAQRKR